MIRRGSIHRTSKFPTVKQECKCAARLLGAEKRHESDHEELKLRMTTSMRVTT